MDITLREILVSIAISLILIGFGFWISSGIENAVNESNEKYFKSLKINNDEDMFKYAIKTNVGYTLAEGNIQAVDGVSISDIEGTYFQIKKVREEYTMHTREVEHTRTKSDGTEETYYTTEEYWTWDYAGEEKFHTEKFSFLGVNFDYGTINFYNDSHNTTRDGGYHVRYQYYTIPFEFQGTLFTFIKDNTITENHFHLGSKIENVIQGKENASKVATSIFWILWIIFIAGIDYGYVSLENRYLEDR